MRNVGHLRRAIVLVEAAQRRGVREASWWMSPSDFLQGITCMSRLHDVISREALEPSKFTAMSSRRESAPRLGGSLAVVLFIAILFAFVVQSQLTQVRAT